MKKRLLQTIVAIVLAVSVFLSQSQVVKAAGDEEWPEVPGKFDGTYVFRGQRARIASSAGDVFLTESDSGIYTSKYYSGGVCIGYFYAEFMPGYSYDGDMTFTLAIPFQYQNLEHLVATYTSFSVVPLSGDGWSVSGMSAYTNTDSGGTSTITVEVVVRYNNFSVSTGTSFGVPIYVECDAYTRSLGGYQSGVMLELQPAFVSLYRNDIWEAAQVYDGSTTQYYINEQTTVIKEQHNEQMQQQIEINQQQMQQQQEIAAAQASQSAKQHEQAINGYDNEANNAMLQDKGSQLAAYEASQGAAFDTGQKYVMDFSTNYSTSAFHNLSPSFILLSGWFNRLWSSLGNFTSILAVALVLCVAGYILKIKH